MRSSTRGVLAAAVALTTVVGFSPVADADRDEPLPTKAEVQSAQDAVAAKAGDVASLRAQLVVARTRLEKAAARAEMAAEAYNGARWRLAQATRDARAAQAAALAAGRTVEEQRAGIAALVTQSYQGGTELAQLSAYLSPGGPQELADRISVTETVAGSLQDQYDAYVAADALATAARAAAEDAKRDQEALTRKAASARDAAAAAAASAQATASAIAAQRRRLIVQLAAAQKISVALAAQRQAGLERIAQEKAAAAAAAHAAALAAQEQKDKDEKADQPESKPGSKPESKPDSKPDSTPDKPADPAPPAPPAAAGSAAKAIQFARAQLGEPYLWAAAGPNAWDCSGLTMMAWRAGGVSLPHYSAAQYDATTPVGVNDLRPGDLVFWGDSPSSIYHVALYLGDNKIIHAPRTGRPVTIDSMYYWIPPSYFGRP